MNEAYRDGDDGRRRPARGRAGDRHRRHRHQRQEDLLRRRQPARRCSRPTPEDAPVLFAEVEGIKADLRRLETLGRPVVAAINGAALGGGLEIALACHHRIAVDDPRTELGLPEVTLGLLPGGGGVTRMVRMLGLTDALMERAAHRHPVQAGRRPGRRASSTSSWPTATTLVPGRQGVGARAPRRRGGRRTAVGPAGLPDARRHAEPPRSWRRSCRRSRPTCASRPRAPNYPAPRAILSAAVEGAQVDFETATRIESRYFTKLIVGQNSKNMIQAFFFDLQAINSGTLRPEGVETFRGHQARRARRRDDGRRHRLLRGPRRHRGRAQGRHRRGRREGQGLLRDDPRQGDRPRQDDRGARRPEILARITPTADPADLAGCDSVIEAVFEDPALKAKVFAEVQDVVNPDALLVLEHLDAADHRARRRR